MKVYVSGPMSGYIDFNRPAFHAAAAHLRAKGYDVVNPAELDEGSDTSGWSHADFLRRDIEWLIGCDLIYLLPGWRYSKGATLEKTVADGVGIMELRDPDVETWRTFEGDPEPEIDESIGEHPGLHVLLCEAMQGDGEGNEWCTHGNQIRWSA